MEPNTQEQNLLHNLETEGKDLKISKVILIFIVVIILGILTGFLIPYSKKTLSNQKTAVNSSNKVKASAGIKDKKNFKDSVSGILREGGIDGEGQFHLERPGGLSQNVYLTSTIVDLSPYIGKKVKVFGETFQGEKAGWLMDVGYVEVL